MSADTATRTSAEEIDCLCREYGATGDTRIRDQLVLTLTPLVDYIVGKKLHDVPAHFDVEDFVSCGLVALIGAIDGWDPAKGATLKQYAWTRIHGAVLDELRNRDWAPRSLRRWQRAMAQQRANFTTRHHRPPSTAELAAALGISPSVLVGRLDDLNRAEIQSLNRTVRGQGQSPTELVDLIESQDPDAVPGAAYDREQHADRVHDAIARLSQRERMIVHMMYAEDCTLREVGEFLGLTESRISQIHRKIKGHLQTELAAEHELYAAA